MILTSRASTHACTAALSRIKNAKKSGRVQTLVSLEKKTVVVRAPPKVESEEKEDRTPRDLLKGPSFFVLRCLGFEKLSKFRVLKIQREKKREENGRPKTRDTFLSFHYYYKEMRETPARRRGTTTTTTTAVVDATPGSTKRGSDDGDNDDDDEEEEEEDVEEETFVLVDLPTFVPMLPGETLRFERLDTDAPVLKTSTGKTYEGYYERTIGEALLVEPADKSCVSYASPRSGKKRVVLKANGEEEEDEESGDGANVRAATEVRLKFRKPVEKM